MKRGKTNSADAAAICEAVTRPSMRVVAIKSEACSSVLVLHRTRIFWFANARTSVTQSEHTGRRRSRTPRSIRSAPSALD
uniref:Transposase n=1 Tax=Sinorhizobium arboris TaxID=76745 RepID=D1CSI1_9HYPH|nr:transposase [Sinorhizobium arboris LMG 14919]